MTDEMNVDLFSFEEDPAARDARKPDIDGLDDAITVLEDGSILPLFDVGDKIVIERRATILPGCPWLDTQTYTVIRIDDSTGDVALWNDSFQQNAMTNVIAGVAAGFRFKFPGKAKIGKSRRGSGKRVRKPAEKKVTVEKPSKPEPKPGEKRGRGRPPGSKNRPKDVIAAEKKEKAAARKAKKAAQAEKEKAKEKARRARAKKK